MDTTTTLHTPDDLRIFFVEVFASLVRKDQRVTSSFYLQGLMLEGRCTSMQPMAERLSIDHKRLQQSGCVVVAVRAARRPLVMTMTSATS